MQALALAFFFHTYMHTYIHAYIQAYRTEQNSTYRRQSFDASIVEQHAIALDKLARLSWLHRSLVLNHDAVVCRDGDLSMRGDEHQEIVLVHFVTLVTS